ncbi:nitroreductase family protein [Raoultella sp. BAC10a-01-01]|uniref:Nitroreductase family protein n=1 Tax=Raoultella scottii TaxID=3040937 RepID=A0ABU8Z5C9_9ENTR
MKKLITKVLGNSIIARAKCIKASLNYSLISICAKTRFLSSLYYFFLCKDFKRENQAVLYGKMTYKKSLTNVGKTSALLRRNIHRLEKGLIMRPRRPIFAKDYILETVEHYSHCISLNTVDGKEIKWATDVITEYFNSITINNEKDVIKAKELFLVSKQNENKGQYGIEDFIPYAREKAIRSNITRDELRDLFLQRRSVRWFDQNKPVEENLILEAIDLATLAPSACNRQPFKFYYTVDKNIAREISKIPMGTAGFSDNLMALIVVVGDLSYYPYERDRHVIYIDASLASMQLMLALESLGLSSCPVNWPDIESFEIKMEQKLGIPKYQRPIILLPVGYADPDGLIPSSPKKSSAELAIKI